MTCSLAEFKLLLRNPRQSTAGARVMSAINSVSMTKSVSHLDLERPGVMILFCG